MLRFLEENPQEFFADSGLPALWRQFHDEFEGTQGLPYSFNADFFGMMAVMNSTIIVTARDTDHNLKGFTWTMIAPVMHHPESSAANVNVIFLAKDVRSVGLAGNGIRLLLKTLDTIKERGVSKVYVYPNADGTSPTLAPTLSKLGFKKETEIWGWVK